MRCFFYSRSAERVNTKPFTWKTKKAPEDEAAVAKAGGGGGSSSGGGERGSEEGFEVGDDFDHAMDDN